ncbi:dihydrofolate reductase family protein [Streptomyces sp. MB09-01]|uniref:dihydrofolate reductase family protein n=1 Tax=Streptomyces sp. MB09-01 TaxID=3028666 RepID=UPI0029BADBAB|nr:dihydrofolate reductase family protein [Streptomyces sp. MB09-01]MDX3535693.1 dihydrofolate reductase family protein [Streptomyces sp. MB09-01]
MGKLIHLVHQSLDGYIEGPDGEFDWPAMGPQLSAYSRELTPEGTVFLYGRKVWELMSGFWPKAEQYSQDPHDLAFAPLWRAAPKVVVSRTLTTAGFNAQIISDNVAEQINGLKESGQDLVLFGGAELAAHLTAHRVIDEYHVVTHPVLLGGGRPTFPAASQRTELELVGTRSFDGRSTLLRHQLTPPAAGKA